MENYNITNSITKSDLIAQFEKLEYERLIDPKIVWSLQQPYTIKAAAYLRVSTIDQAKDDKVSLEEQDTEIKGLCERRGWNLVDIYQDGGKSGGTFVGRDDFNRMINNAKIGKYDLIIGWNADRLARNMSEMTVLRDELMKINIQVTTVLEPTVVHDPRKLLIEGNNPIEKFLAMALDWKAEQDKNTIANRFRIGKVGKAKKGIIPVKTPYGLRKEIKYLNGDRRQKDEHDVIVPEQAAVVREIFNLYDLNSWGMRRIAEHLNMKGLPSPRGKVWCYSTIKYTLQNPTNCGMVRYGWRLCDSKTSRTRLSGGHQGIITQGKHEAIISVEQFNRVQEKMKRRANLGGKAIHSKGLLTGLLKCWRCGGRVHLGTYSNWLAYTKKKEERDSHKRTEVYMCSAYCQRGRSACTQRYVVSSGKVEEVVIEQIRKLAEDEETREEFVRQMRKSCKKEVQVKLKGLEAGLVENDKKKDRITYAYTNGFVKPEDCKREMDKIELEKCQLVQSISDTRKQLDREEQTELMSKEVILALANFNRAWERADFQKRKDLLQSIIEKVVYRPKNTVEIHFLTQNGT